MTPHANAHLDPPSAQCKPQQISVSGGEPMPAYRSRTTTHGRNMAGARRLWRATGMKDGDFGKPINAIVSRLLHPEPLEGTRP